MLLRVYRASFSLFSQLLDIVELKFAEGDKSVYTLLHSVLAQPFPDPGRTIEAHTFRAVLQEDGQTDYVPEQFRLTRSNDDYEYLEYVTYDTLFRSLDVDKILLIFECLLSERRILVVAKNLSTLTSCMDAISNMPYPFAWQYVFIPILPKTMLSFLCAPMPFLMGILSSSLEAALKEPMEEGVLIVDVDNNEILQAPEDLPPTLPVAAIEKLRKSLKKIVASPKRHMEFSIDVAHSLIKFWTSLFGNYSKYMEPVYETNASSPTPSTQNSALVPVNGGQETANKVAASSSATNSPSSEHPSSSSAPSNAPNSVTQGPPVAYHFNFERFTKSKAVDVKKFLTAFRQFQLYDCFMQEREEWMKKGLINYCIILRASNAKKKDSIAAVKAKFRSQVDKMFAAWNNESATNSNGAKKVRPVTTVSVDTDSSRKDSTDTRDSRESPDSSAAIQESGSDSEASGYSSSNATKGTERPRAATVAPTVPAKPAKGNRKLTTANTVSSSTKDVAPPETPKRQTNRTLSNSADQPSASSVSDTSPPKKAIPFSSRFTFKPTPLIEGTFDKQIWKLCNVEAFADTQLASNEGHKYWAYSPVLFQRLPELSKVEKVGNVIALPLSDGAIELLLEWVFGDEVWIENVEPILELLTHFPHSKSATNATSSSTSHSSARSAKESSSKETSTSSRDHASNSNDSSSHLRYVLATSALKKICMDNVVQFVKVFSGQKANQEDPLVVAILNAAKLLVANFKPEDMTPLVRRQLSAVTYTTLASILHMHSSASARQEAQDCVDQLLKEKPSGSSSSARSWKSYGGGSLCARSNGSDAKVLAGDLLKLLESGEFSDVTLVFPAAQSKSSDASSAKEVEIKAHAKILAARSPHLAKILGLNLGPDHQTKILNVSAANFKALLPFIYSGRLEDVKEDREKVYELVQAAHVLDLDSVAFRTALYANLSTQFTTTSVFEFLDVPTTEDGSLQHPAERAVLVGAAAHFLANHATIFYRPEKLKTLEPDVWECIFKNAYAPTAESAAPTSPRSVKDEPKKSPRPVDTPTAVPSIPALTSPSAPSITIKKKK